ncbi:DsrE family protein [Streptomyces sp. 110]|uniref:DsrE family protein n=1 Tax=Streptomyces endocoffeicus TaxID=2898945 RepID=A0ABS1PWR7_9ACTN|nr:DsrE family protein [Streptomyces endocoffeicus]MBL1116870.1 DsrE family protein [Streptomyces endocoffeicus]
MNEYLLIESGGPPAGPGSHRFAGDAAQLVREGEDVALFLVENGVAGAVRGAMPELDALLRLGGRLWVDAFSLRRRAVDAGDLVPGARLVEMRDVARKLLSPAVRVVWH